MASEVLFIERTYQRQSSTEQDLFTRSIDNSLDRRPNVDDSIDYNDFIGSFKETLPPTSRLEQQQFRFEGGRRRTQQRCQCGPLCWPCWRSECAKLLDHRWKRSGSGTIRTPATTALRYRCGSLGGAYDESPLLFQKQHQQASTENCHSNNQYCRKTSATTTRHKLDRSEASSAETILQLFQLLLVTLVSSYTSLSNVGSHNSRISFSTTSARQLFPRLLGGRRKQRLAGDGSGDTDTGSSNSFGREPEIEGDNFGDATRRHSPHPAAAVGVQKAVRLFLSALLVVNMFTFLHGASAELVDASAGVVASAYSDSRSRISMVQYLEPLSRPTKAPKCDQTFVSRSGGPSNGTFNAPLLTNPTNHSRQCLYIFLAGPGQRVDVSFTSFSLRGSPPECVHEYMDVYAEVQSSDPAELINSPFGGRYCGPIPPRRRISLYRAIALSFYTDKNSTSPDIFEGRYAFINESEYEIGQPVIGSPCSYVINFAQKRTGAIISPTYPGAYPKDMSCTYQFIGKPNQRVRVEFRDFDLFFGGPHCPFDYVRVFDGPDNTSAVIGTYCGQQRNLVLYSSEQYLFVHFSTLQRTANTQNRGFKGIFEFSESFVKLDFIRENDGMHIRGSECDQKILSKKESTGFVYSPNYPFPYIPKVVCRYFVYGMQDAQNLERVKLEFSIFEIPKGEHKGESNCTDGYLKVYLKGQEVADAYDKFDHELCGNELPHAVISDGPRLVMVFSSGELQGRGFKAKYTFETEYKIPGTAAPDGTCSFTYRSTSRKKGEFNSPRYPSNYPSETNCSYVFLATPNEQVTIVFDHFKVKADGANTTYGAYGASVCFEDWLEMYVLYRDGTDRFLGRYCSLTAPGPVESPRGAVGIRVVLHTDQENVASGFKARYIFETAKSVFGDCGGNYSGEDSGIVTSPNFPANYDAPGKGLASRACNWYITARVGYKILINFDYFGIEGEPATRGCAAAVLRLWLSPDTDMPPIEMCGEKPAMEHWQYVTQGQTARISFTSADKAIGAQGFRIIWTEVQDSPVGPSSTISLLCESTYHFQCLASGYCISERLRCDGVKNCGAQDNSDEMHCTIIVPEEDHGALIISCIAAASFLICLLCTLCHRKRKRRHHRQLGLHRNAAHYDSTTSATGISLGSSRRHLQSGGSLSGSLHGINNSEPMQIPPAPLPPIGVPPHVCINDTLLDPDDLNDDLFVNSCDRFDDNGECV
ncbi:cubilin isoform X3 [Toxorhynchites rutilus septentrionalis]|uniref:cubilin isoform X3 n=1 Tax=Toxorhynchites rutilus septentrionalis TaxID=329112 RepID=UPI002478B69E|nr:cubilin isoform X3 [Toxorhynchites rutilus septentrionalis]